MAKRKDRFAITPELKTVIDAAVQAGLQAGRAQGSRTTEDPYKATERRLYNYPVLQEKVMADKEKLVRLRTGDSPERSRGIVLSSRPGYRLSPEERLETMILGIEADIAADTQELEDIETALDIIASEEYAEIIPMIYFKGLTIDEVAQEIFADRSTVFRNRKKLINRISVRLYGALACR